MFLSNPGKESQCWRGDNPGSYFPLGNCFWRLPKVQLSEGCSTSCSFMGASRGSFTPGSSRSDQHQLPVEEDGDGDSISRPFPCHVSRDTCLGDCPAEPCLVLHEFVPVCDLWGGEDGPTLSYDPASSSDGLASSLLLFTLFLVKQWGMGREDAATSAGAGVKQGADHHQDSFPSYSLPSS